MEKLDFVTGELVPEHFSWYFLCILPFLHQYHLPNMLQWEIIAYCRRCLFFIFWYVQVHVMYREIWVHPLNWSRLDKGEFYSLYPNLRHYPQKFFTFYRMPVAKFDELLWLIAPRIRRKSTNFCQPISPEQQLVLTLRCVLSAYYHYVHSYVINQI